MNGGKFKVFTCPCVLSNDRKTTSYLFLPLTNTIWLAYRDFAIRKFILFEDKFTFCVKNEFCKYANYVFVVYVKRF